MPKSSLEVGPAGTGWRCCLTQATQGQVGGDPALGGSGAPRTKAAPDPNQAQGGGQHAPRRRERAAARKLAQPGLATADQQQGLATAAPAKQSGARQGDTGAVTSSDLAQLSCFPTSPSARKAFGARAGQGGLQPTFPCRGAGPNRATQRSLTTPTASKPRKETLNTKQLLAIKNRVTLGFASYPRSCSSLRRPARAELCLKAVISAAPDRRELIQEPTSSPAPLRSADLDSSRSHVCRCSAGVTAGLRCVQRAEFCFRCLPPPPQLAAGGGSPPSRAEAMRHEACERTEHGRAHPQPQRPPPPLWG